MTNFAGLPRAVGEALQDEPVPDWRPPTLATLTEDRFSDPHWIFERKFRRHALRELSRRRSATAVVTKS